MPILKQLVSSSSQSKRRSRVDLTADMISAPLGDFRHTMHVGRGGDVFGDTSFLSTRFGDAAAEPQPKPSLLSRKFRSSSKRSQSVTRVDKRDTLSVSDDTDAFVKNAVSLPQLNDQVVEAGGQLPKSLSSSPVRKLTGDKAEEKPLNGAAGTADRSTDYQEERDFGDLTDLPPSRSSIGFPLKHAESIMSFHVDLGPSMLNDILSVMEKDAWENDSDLGFGDERPDDYVDSHNKKAPGKQFSEGSSVSPLVLQHSVKSATYSPGSGSHLSQGTGSVSSLASGTTEERQSVYEGVSHGDGDSIKYTDSVKEEGEEEEEEDEGGKDFAFMDEEDEIRV